MGASFLTGGFVVRHIPGKGSRALGRKGPFFVPGKETSWGHPGGIFPPTPRGGDTVITTGGPLERPYILRGI